MKSIIEEHGGINHCRISSYTNPAVPFTIIAFKAALILWQKKETLIVAGIRSPKSKALNT
jgi:hypothetical protein